MTYTIIRGKPHAGNPHVRFDEGEVASATTPRRGSLLYRMLVLAMAGLSVSVAMADVTSCNKTMNLRLVA